MWLLSVHPSPQVDNLRQRSAMSEHAPGWARRAGLGVHEGMAKVMMIVV